MLHTVKEAFVRIAGRLHGAVAAYDDAVNFTCDICGREVFRDERVCAACLAALPAGGELCPHCGRRVGEAGLCLSCKARAPRFYKARAPFRYEGEAAHLVLRFKGGEKFLFRTLAELTAPLVMQEFPTESLTFVPMTATSERARGYNQSRLFAERLAALCQRPLLDVLEKRRETDMQKSLGKQARAANLKGCFRVTDRAAVRGQAILLVDDVLTTGATAEEVSSVLLSAGAERVGVVTFANVSEKLPAPPAPAASSAPSAPPAPSVSL